MTSTKRQRASSVLSSQQPLFYAALAFAAGIVFGARVWHPPNWWIAASLVFIFSATFFLARQRIISLSCGLLALSALGALTLQTHEQPDTGNPEVVRVSDGSEMLVTGHVIGLTLAHDRAIAYWGDYRQASRSQYWMLAVMVSFTCFGLYLLSQANR